MDTLTAPMKAPTDAVHIALSSAPRWYTVAIRANDGLYSPLIVAGQPYRAMYRDVESAQRGADLAKSQGIDAVVLAFEIQNAQETGR